MKRMLALCLALCLFALLLPIAAWADGALVAPGETATLKVFRYMDTTLQDYISDWNETPFYQELERQTGVKVEFISPPYSTAVETLNMMLMSGEMPDIIIGSRLYSSGSYQAVLDGYFVDLAPYLEENAPEYWSIITSSDAMWREVVDDGGVISSVYRIFRDPNPAWMRLVLKQEILDKLGVSDVPITIADWESLFEKMLAVGMTPYALNPSGYEEKLIGAFDVRRDFFQEAGTVKYGQIEPGFKSYLALMNDWYQRGFISKDFVSISNVDTLFALDEVGTYDRAIVAAYNFGVAEGYTVRSTPYPRLVPDQFLHWDSYKASNLAKNFDYGTIAVTASCQNVELAVKWINYLFTEEGSLLTNWGIEGLNYEVVDGQNRYLPEMWDYQGISQEGLNYYFKSHNAATYTYADSTVHANLLKSPEATAIRLEFDDDPLLDSALYLPLVSLTEDESETRTSIMTDIDTYVNEMVLKFIIGTESLDNWDNFVQTVLSMDLEKAIAATQSAYDRYMAVTAE